MRAVVYLVIISILIFSFVSVSKASDIDSLIRLLVKKGIITEEEAGQLKEEISKEKEEAKAEEKSEYDTNKGIFQVSGALHGEFRWQKHGDIIESDPDSTSDLYLRRIEIAVEATLTDWARASAVFTSEWIGDEVNQSDEKIEVDEAVLTLNKEGFPLYLIIGKRTQPFGVFENPLITDPMTQDAYETKAVGLTVGYKGPVGLDLSLTVYKDEAQINHLFESGLFEEALQRVATDVSDDIDSFILSGSISPLKDRFTFSVSYISEPGWSRRNETVSIGLNSEALILDRFRLYAEYMKALHREKYATVDEEYKEGVISLAASYGMSESLDVALRYEHFDDDSISERLGIWTVRDRYSVGTKYNLYRNDTVGLEVFIAGEYRRTEFRAHGEIPDSNDEIYIRLGADF
jgi:hypothetical protein